MPTEPNLYQGHTCEENSNFVVILYAAPPNAKGTSNDEDKLNRVIGSTVAVCRRFFRSRRNIVQARKTRVLPSSMHGIGDFGDPEGQSKDGRTWLPQTKRSAELGPADRRPGRAAAARGPRPCRPSGRLGLRAAQPGSPGSRFARRGCQSSCASQGTVQDAVASSTIATSGTSKSVLP